MKAAGRYSEKIRFLAVLGILLAVLAGCRKENPDARKTEEERWLTGQRGVDGRDP